MSLFKKVGKAAGAVGAATIGGGLLSGLLGGGGGGGGNIQVPGLSPEELALLEKSGVTLDHLNKILSGQAEITAQDQNLLRSLSGLYGADGQINKDALAALQGRISQTQAVEQQIQDQQAQAFLSALSGDYTPSQAMLNREARDFKLMQEAAGQRGVRIEGSNPYDAFAAGIGGGTAAAQQIGRIREGADTIRELDRQSILNRGFMGFGAPQQLNYLSAAQQAGPAQLMGGFGQVAQGYQNLTQPYTDQRYLQFQGDLQNRADAQARRAGALGLIGGIGGGVIGGMTGGPMGAGMGFGIGSGVGQGLAGIYR